MFDSGAAGQNLGIDTFTAIMFGSVAALVLWCLLVALITRKTHVSDVFDRRRGAELSTQATIEGQEVGQMLAGANEYRRKRGLPDLTPARLRARVDKDLRQQISTHSAGAASSRARDSQKPQIDAQIHTTPSISG